MTRPIHFGLTQAELPTHWYNIQADLPEPLPLSQLRMLD